MSNIIHDRKIVGNVTRKVTFKQLSDGNEQALIPVVRSEKNAEGKYEKVFQIFRHFIKKEENSKLKAFYASLNKSDFVSVYTKQNGQYENVVATFANKKANA